jgi:hydrogenase expression/formation protein HypC
MCLAVPGKIIELKGQTAKVDINGMVTEANTMLLEKVKKGDYVLVHTGFAIQKYDKKEAEETLKLLSKAAKNG